MKLLRPLLAFLLLTIAGSLKTYAQVDSVFWFAAPWVTPGHADNVPVVLRLSTFGQPTAVRIQQPASTYDTTINIAANSLFSHDLSHMINTLESKPADMALNYGLKITSDNPITAVYEVVTVVNNPETYSLKGRNAIGTEFITPFQTRWNNWGYAPQPKSMICIVATQNNTTVYITPKADVIGHPAENTYTVVLQAGQTYTCENATANSAAPGNNLSGTVIYADKPVSVTVSDDSVASETGGCRDLMGDQIVPVDVVGVSYVVNKGDMYPGANEGVFIVATQNSTTISINDGTVTSTLINRGDTYFYNISNPLTYIAADQPVYVLQATGFGCELGEALLPPINCAGSNQLSFTRTNGQTFILNLVCRSNATGSFTLNGNTTLIPASAFSFVPGTGNQWSGAQITFSTDDIPSGTTNFITNSSGPFGMGVINGGALTGCLYHYMSSFIRFVTVEAGNDTTLCSGEPSIPLEGDVRDGVTTGIWTVPDGTGTLTDPTDLSTTYIPSADDYSQGSLTFVLTSTGDCEPVSDTMTVTFVLPPVVAAGPDDFYCLNGIDTISLNGSVSFPAVTSWSGGNGGEFGNTGNPSTTYIPSTADLEQDSIIFILALQGSSISCPSDSDSLVVYFTKPPVVLAGSDQAVCASAQEVSLNGVVGGGASTGIWTTSGSGTFSPSASDFITAYLISDADKLMGNITLTLTSANNDNCLAVSDSMLLGIIDRPVVGITTSDSICLSSSSIHLTGTVASDISTTWTVDGTGNVLDPQSPDTYYNLGPSDMLNGYIEIHFSSLGGICPGESDSLRITFVNPPVVFAGADQASCNNLTVQLNGTVLGADTSGSWYTLGTGSFLPGPDSLSTNYFPSADDYTAGSVNLVLLSSDAFSCPAERDTITITFKPAPAAGFSTSTSCQNESTVFTDQSVSADGALLTWLYAFGDGDTSIAQNPLHNYPASGTYTASLIITSANGCSDTVTSNVTVLPVPVPGFVYDPICENSPFNLTDNSFIATGSVVSWQYDFGSGSISIMQNPTYTYTTAGTYPVIMTVTSGPGCIGTTTIPVDVLAGPTANFNVSPNPGSVLENIYFTDQTTDSSIAGWYWDFGDGESDNQSNTVHNYDTEGNYVVTLTVTDVSGCRDSIEKIVSLSPLPTPSIPPLLPVLPTGFTPNGDGENDVFIIRGGPFKSVDFRIYSNWGEEVFSTTDAEIGWDGTLKGEPAPLGIYTWMFVVNLPNGDVIKKSGDITLMR